MVNSLNCAFQNQTLSIFQRQGIISLNLKKSRKILSTVKFRLYAMGLYNFVRVFGWAYKRRGLYPGGGGGGGGGAYKRNKKKMFRNEPR